MKKLFSTFLVFVICLSLVCCKGGEGQGSKKNEYGTEGLFLSKYKVNCMNFDTASDNETVKQVDKQADKLRDTIVKLPDTLTAAKGGATYYVSESGSNTNDGTSHENALKTAAALPKLNLKAGDVVLFERGGTYRGKFELVSGVSYGAYGKGDKPCLYGSRENAAEHKWTLTEQENIYVYRYVVNNVGLVVFDHGQQTSVKKFEMDELRQNFDFCVKNSRLYLYCDKGNPAKLFNSIELCEERNIITAPTGSHDITLENLQIMYGGAHGFQAVNSKNITVRGLVVGFIGGSVQPGYPGKNVRYGNGIEFWASCDNILVDKCYVFQCYDDAITHQSIGEDVVESNITYSNNLLEYNSSSFTYFIADSTQKSIMKNITITDNIIRYNCYGWGNERPSNSLASGVSCGTVSQLENNRSENFIIKNNVFDRARRNLIVFAAYKKEWLPTYYGNTYIQNEDKQLFAYQSEGYVKHKIFRADETGVRTVKDVLGDTAATVVILPKQ